MKNIVYIVVLVVLLPLVGCRHDSAPKFNSLDQLIDDNPDSAYIALLGLAEDARHYNEADRMRYGLLRLKCQNILDVPFDSRDTIETIVDYYDSHGTYNEALLATYLMGRSCMVSGNEPMAMTCFNKCVAMKKESEVDIDYHQLSKVHSQLAEIYDRQGIVNYELNELEHAEEYAYISGDTVLALTYNQLKTHVYYTMGRMDSVISITNNTRQKYLSMNMRDKAAEVLYLLIDVYLQRQQKEKAWQCMSICEKESGVVDSFGGIRQGREAFLYLKGCVFEAYGLTDDAERQYRQLLKYDRNTNLIEGAYKGLLSVYRTKGVADSIGKYATLYCNANDTLHAESVAAEVSRLKERYDYSQYKQKAEVMRLEAEKKEMEQMVMGILFLFVLLGIAYAVYMYRGRKQNEVNRLLDLYDQKLQIIEELNDDRDEMIRNHQAELEDIQKILHDKGISLTDENIDAFDQQDLLAKFKRYGDSVKDNIPPITDEDWQNLFMEMSKKDSKFMLLLRESGLSDKEMKIATMIRLRFKDYQIKRILNAYGSYLPNYKARINKKLFNEPSAKTLRRLLYTKILVAHR